MNPEAMAAIQPELLPGESIVWAGRPNPRIVFHHQDAILIPFSLLWGGFAIFWEAGVMGLGPLGTHSGQPWGFGVIWGIPFVLIGQYLILGPLPIQLLEEGAHLLRGHESTCHCGSKSTQSQGHFSLHRRAPNADEVRAEGWHRYSDIRTG